MGACSLGAHSLATSGAAHRSLGRIGRVALGPARWRTGVGNGWLGRVAPDQTPTRARQPGARELEHSRLPVECGRATEPPGACRSCRTASSAPPKKPGLAAAGGSAGGGITLATQRGTSPIRRPADGTRAGQPCERIQHRATLGCPVTSVTLEDGSWPE